MSELKQASLHDYITSAADIIEEARAGRMFILVDDEDRENEGDLVIPAQFATPDAINFMARHARGLICLAMTRHRVEQLGLPLMAQANGTRHQTAFTVSIEAREGVTTGISAHDRAHTIAVAVNPELGRDAITTPGHVFSAGGARGRLADPRRAYRSGGGHRSAGRAEPGGRDLRGDERRRVDGPVAGPGGLRAAPQPKARHHRRPDRAPPPHGEAGAAGGGGRGGAGRGRRLDDERLRQHRRVCRAPGAGKGRPGGRAAAAGAGACCGSAGRHAGRPAPQPAGRGDAHDRGRGPRRRGADPRGERHLAVRAGAPHG